MSFRRFGILPAVPNLRKPVREEILEQLDRCVLTQRAFEVSFDCDDEVLRIEYRDRSDFQIVIEEAGLKWLSRECPGDRFADRPEEHYFESV